MDWVLITTDGHLPSHSHDPLQTYVALSTSLAPAPADDSPHTSRTSVHLLYTYGPSILQLLMSTPR